MVVVDSSALIPLSRVGRLDLISETFGDIHTTDAVRDEVLTAGKPGTAALQAFLNGVTISENSRTAEELARLEGIAIGDASVIVLAANRSDVLLANDKALIEVAKTREIDCWWVTTLLLDATKSGKLTPAEASDVLYELVDVGMHLHPKVYARVQRAFEGFGG